ncbi:GPI ethanolamine phosphate transferase 2 isoform X3 [Cucumis sativus]|nr:GPI ethanolamine phosphate transferase 2 isoform X3 [Cucumis sativus]XP_031744090.1 GPI ethanolamine phosphate transferase 2 isoform X3 [Cucumis sativus]XP_031744091.1 GPI ethanolamine phosphate transferase 2 isoform X3 [Cucumis sativus]XP_031744092.1 GPI ethanolamine phosphate transferase 2 isoform X3 [Cucumis sativus]
MEAMPYTQSLLANGIAKGYHAKAAPPTVTMPRLKAIVSGAIGGFLDVAFNFNTQALLDDNLLGQLSKVGWKMVMCGDETWLKLFPGLFMRHDGVSSFFVKDTVEVDKNVSRHLSYELSKNDWNLLILHYLGLDHVGHTGGRNSPLMAPKLMEMDEVVKMMHASAVMNPDDKRRTLLVVASDHGMTENGNHGGSSYEETDSLLLFIGSKSHATDFPSIISNDVNQVDIAPTLALLFGVPIPKNNVGVMIPGVIDFLKDTQQLRALQLNSWQLLRLLQKQVPGFPCGSFPCDGFSGDQGYNSNDIMEKFCRLYLRSAFLHDSWISTELSRSDSREDKSEIIAAYYEFLINANQWLSHKATDKPSTVIVFGVMSMILSFLIFSISIYSIIQESYSGEKQLSNGIFTQHLDEGFSLCVIFILVISMGSSSMVEEEQYIWHYLISTLNLLFLRKTMQLLQKESTCRFFTLFNGHGKVCIRISSIFTLLITGRILRGWHQGGVNWTHLPDISKWLEQSGIDLHLIQLTAVILTIILILFSLSLLGRGMKIVLVVGFNFLMSGLLVLYHILRYQHNASLPSSNAATSLAQIIYATLGVSTVGTVLAVPWIMPIQISKACCSDRNQNSAVSHPLKIGSQSQYPELIYSLFIIGWVYIGSWCLLQLLLQQPVNSVVTLLILMQIFASFLFFSQRMLQQKQWVEVAVLYYIGMAGHFALGNSNSLATVDVAGAFIGISNYSALLSGILMFIITYASPTLLLLSLVMYISIKNLEIAASPQNVDSGHVLKRILGLPCLVPLTINSILLMAYTIVLILMRNHLFVWSVFSPKYLYACATTVCVLIGVFVVATTVSYAYMVLALRKKYEKLHW